jgi:hypothetical protein
VKLITRILSEEIKTLKQTPIADRFISDNSWTAVESRSSHRKTTPQTSTAVHIAHEIPVTNWYAVLSNHHEPQKTSDWSSQSNFEQPAGTIARKLKDLKERKLYMRLNPAGQ